MYLAKKVGQISTIELSDVGEVIANNIDYYRKPPKYKDTLDKTRKAKYGY
jgi:hypothetical protein